MFRDLIPRTVVLLSIATAIVAVSIALELPQRGGGGEAAHTAAGPHAPAQAPAAQAQAPAAQAQAPAAQAQAPAAQAPGAGAHTVTSEAGFIVAMVAHHQEAVDVAREVTERGERDDVRALAAAIAVEQAAEIDRLRAWWTAWHPNEPPADDAPMMRRLEGLTPAEVDVVFVTEMILHHEAAVAMADDVLARGAAVRPEVEALARDVIRIQGEEIATLRGWLDAWSAPQPEPAPSH